MKATGIIRRIDDLGRVVIPKEIRRTLKIREGDPLEIFLGEQNTICFKKYCVLGKMDDEVLRVAVEMARKSNLAPIAIYDRGEKLKGMENFPSYVPDEWRNYSEPFLYNATYGVYPIITNGDFEGYVVCDHSSISVEMGMIARYLSVAIEE